jgi:hypothetical protein
MPGICGPIACYETEEELPICPRDTGETNPHTARGNVVLKTVNMEPDHLGAGREGAVIRSDYVELELLFGPEYFVTANKGSSGTDIFHLCQNATTGMLNENRPINRDPWLSPSVSSHSPPPQYAVVPSFVIPTKTRGAERQPESRQRPREGGDQITNDFIVIFRIADLNRLWRTRPE